MTERNIIGKIVAKRPLTEDPNGPRLGDALDLMAGAITIRGLALFAFARENDVDPQAIERTLRSIQQDRRLILPEDRAMAERALTEIGEGEALRAYLNAKGGRGAVETSYLRWDRDQRGESEFFIPGIGKNRKKIRHF